MTPEQQRVSRTLASYETLKSIVTGKGYAWFEGEFDLNYLGFRNPNSKPNSFDDLFALAWLENGMPTVRVWTGTTDPGTFYLENPMLPQGTAILCEGQHRRYLGLGLHRGQYEALVALRPVPVIRDNNRDRVLDFDSKNIGEAHGINHHLAARNARTQMVDKYSAGCQVSDDPVVYWRNMAVFKEYFKRFNSLSYTLLNFKDVPNFDKNKKQRKDEPTPDQESNLESAKQV